MTRKTGPKPELVSRGVHRTAWPPTCPIPDCGFVGEPNDRQTPYAACTIGGHTDPTRHQRTPLGSGVQA